MNPAEDAFETGEVVRPFIVTRGRTRPVSNQLRLETLVSAAPAAMTAPLDFERQAIVELCQYPRSIAEIAALLPVPVGVARVLVADLSMDSHVRVHSHLCGHDDRPSVALLERIRDGLLRL
ncbi:DUF742 domain-containing protein [Streptomyces sp. NBC_00133]|uniref:DUF742 domain-containing protein n=1 Tax=Streptomyces sp. NBC_00133 TaxID=2903624 RepID=UPI00324C0803